MLFSAPTFLFLFLPAAIALHWMVPISLRNLILLGLSILFYWWGEPVHINILFYSILFNWLCGLSIAGAKNQFAKWVLLVFSVSVNVGVLAYFKYSHLFFPKFLDDYASNATAILGISFYTFHSISYVVDIYRTNKKPFLNPINFALYICLFPQLIAGPIIRFKDICDQITFRSCTLDFIVSGAQRFFCGLAKKVLIADSLGVVSDHIFALDKSQLSTETAWLGLLSFSLQIYYDFSGYSDMAIGLSRLFGFDLLENFNYPYIATSITDFWHRWHLSLSAWFRDYLYIPLGGNRTSDINTYRNLFVVFLLCGLWHGANWNFLLWGGYHGLFLTIERIFAFRPWVVFQRIYTLIVVCFGWILFRTESLTHAKQFFASLFGIREGSSYGDGLSLLLSNEYYITLSVAAILAAPCFAFVCKDYAWRRFPNKNTNFNYYVPSVQRCLQSHPIALEIIQTLLVLGLLFLSFLKISGSTSRSFIYFHF